MSGFDNEVMFSTGERLEISSAQAIAIMQNVSTDISRINFNGDPNGSVSANPSSLCHDRVTGNIYLKQTGTGNTGWVLFTVGGVTLTADNMVSLTGTSFNLFGQKASTVPVMDTLVSGGNFLFENRSWETQYVVDASTTTGLQGTFSTIQAALNQAVTDGMTYTAPRKFIIRPGTYVENLVIPGGAFLYAAGYELQPLPIVTIQGNHTLSDICIWATTGITWVAPGGTMFTSGTVLAGFLGTQSVFKNTVSAALIIDSTATSAGIILSWENCTVTISTPFSNAFSTSSSSPAQMNPKNCDFGGGSFTIPNGQFTPIDCLGIGEVNLTSAGTIFATRCQFQASTNPNVYGTSTTCRFLDCIFYNNTGTQNAIDITGLVVAIDCALPAIISTPQDFFSSNVQYAPSYVTVGNVLQGNRSAINVTNTSKNGYIGITDTSSPRTVTLFAGPKDYQIFIVDETGFASGNGITITPTGGALIDGLASYVINRDYGSVLLHYNGTNWFSISGSTLPNVSVSADLGSNLASATGDNTLVSIIFNEILSLPSSAAAYNISTGIFTAPVDGNYLCTTKVQLSGLTASHTTGTLTLNVGPYIFTQLISPAACKTAANTLTMSVTGMAYMAPGDTAFVTIRVTGGTKVVGINGTSGNGTTSASFVLVT